MSKNDTLIWSSNNERTITPYQSLQFMVLKHAKSKKNVIDIPPEKQISQYLIHLPTSSDSYEPKRKKLKSSALKQKADIIQ